MTEAIKQFNNLRTAQKKRAQFFTIGCFCTFFVLGMKKGKGERGQRWWQSSKVCWAKKLADWFEGCESVLWVSYGACEHQKSMLFVHSKLHMNLTSLITYFSHNQTIHALHFCRYMPTQSPEAASVLREWKGYPNSCLSLKLPGLSYWEQAPTLGIPLVSHVLRWQKLFFSFKFTLILSYFTTRNLSSAVY